LRHCDIDFFFHLPRGLRPATILACPWERATCDLINLAFTDEDKAREFLEAFRAGIEAVGDEARGAQGACSHSAV